MSTERIQIWVANQPFPADAILLRQSVPVYLLGSNILMSWATQLAFASDPESVSRRGVPDEYRSNKLYQVRTERYMQADVPIEDQDIEDGDVFVLLHDDNPHWREILNSTVHQFPSNISPGLLLPNVPVSLFEVKKAVQSAEDNRIRAEQANRGNIIIEQSPGVVINSPHASVAVQGVNMASSQDLADQLAQLHAAIFSANTPDEQKEQAAVMLTEAEEAARAGDRSGAVAVLSRAAGWVLGVAQKIGVPVAIEALKSATGIS